MKTFYKEKVDAYIASPEGQASCDPVSLRAPLEMRRYLENRIRAAYAEGWNDGAASYESRMISGEISS